MDKVNNKNKSGWLVAEGYSVKVDIKHALANGSCADAVLARCSWITPVRLHSMMINGNDVTTTVRCCRRLDKQRHAYVSNVSCILTHFYIKLTYKVLHKILIESILCKTFDGNFS